MDDQRTLTRVDHVVTQPRDVWNVFVYGGGVAPIPIGADFATEDRARNVASIVERLANDEMGPLVFPLSILNHGGERYEVEISLGYDRGRGFPTLRISGQNCYLHESSMAPGEYVLSPRPEAS